MLTENKNNHNQISYAVVPNPYSHSTAFNPQFFRNPYLKLKVPSIDLSQSDIQILDAFQIDNGQCLDSS